MKLKNRLQAVLFDLDGTLLDTAPDFYRLLNQMRSERQLPPLDYKGVRAQVSNGAAAMVQHGFNLNPTDAEFEPLRQQLLQAYLNEPVRDSRPFSGIEPVLAWLEQHHIAWGIVTNKPERFCLPILDALNWHRRCSTLICPDHVQQRKPDPEGLLLACEQLGTAPAQCVYIGDHSRDIEAGRNAGMTTIAARYGYIDSEQPIDQWQADQIIDSATELLNWLQPLASTKLTASTRTE